MKRLFVIFVIIMGFVLPIWTQKKNFLSIDDCYKKALEKNKNLLSLYYQVESAKKLVEVAKGAFLPTLNLSSSFAQTNNSTQAFMMVLNQKSLSMMGTDFNHPENTENFNITFSLTQPLYTGGALTNQLHLSKTQVKKQKMQKCIISNNIFRGICDLYCNLLKLEVIKPVYEENVKLYNSYLKLTENLVKHGLGLKKDLYFWQAKIATAKKDLVNLENNINILKNRLSVILGSPEEIKNLNLDKNVLRKFKIKEPQYNTKQVVDLAWRLRPELEDKHIDMNILDIREKIIKSEYFPNVAFFAKYFFDTSRTSSLQNSWIIGVSLEFNIFSGFRTKNKILNVKKQKTAVEKLIEEVRNNIYVEVINDILNIKNSYYSFIANKKALTEAEEHLRIVKENYKNGLAIQTELNSAQLLYISSKRNFIASKVDYFMYLQRLNIDMGKIYQQYKEVILK